MTKKASKPWFIYIIETEKGLYYTGITTDVKRRFEEHKSAKNLKAKFFRGKIPKKIVYLDSSPNRSEASKSEVKIKKLSKPQKIKLVKDNQDQTKKLLNQLF